MLELVFEVLKGLIRLPSFRPARADALSLVPEGRQCMIRRMLSRPLPKVPGSKSETRARVRSSKDRIRVRIHSRGDLGFTRLGRISLLLNGIYIPSCQPHSYALSNADSAHIDSLLALRGTLSMLRRCLLVPIVLVLIKQGYLREKSGALVWIVLQQ